MMPSLAVQFISAKEKYTAPINWTQITPAPCVGSKTSGMNRAKMPASPRTILLDVINNFVFMKYLNS